MFTLVPHYAAVSCGVASCWDFALIPTPCKSIAVHHGGEHIIYKLHNSQVLLSINQSTFNQQSYQHG